MSTLRLGKVIEELPCMRIILSLLTFKNTFGGSWNDLFGLDTLILRQREWQNGAVYPHKCSYLWQFTHRRSNSMIPINFPKLIQIQSRSGPQKHQLLLTGLLILYRGSCSIIKNNKIWLHARTKSCLVFRAYGTRTRNPKPSPGRDTEFTITSRKAADVGIFESFIGDKSCFTTINTEG